MRKVREDSLRSRFPSIGLLSLLVFLSALRASAGEVAIVCAHPEVATKAPMAVAERWRTWSVLQHLGRVYDRVDVQSCIAPRDAIQVAAQLVARTSRHRTDFFDFRASDLVDSELFYRELTQLMMSREASGSAFERLRLVILPTNAGSKMWHKLGARAVLVAPPFRSEVTERAWISSFVRSWTEGSRLSVALNGAHQDALSFHESLVPWLADSWPVGRRLERRFEVLGQDVQRGFLLGRSSVDAGISLPQGRVVFDQKVLSPPASFRSLTDSSGVQLFGALALPGAQLVPNSGGVSELIEKASGPAWELLKGSFPYPIAGIPGRIDEDSPDGELAWIDGDGLRYFLSPLRSWLGDSTDRLLGAILGLRLNRRESGLSLALHLREALQIPMSQVDLHIPDGELRSIHLPRTLRLGISIRDGVVVMRVLPVVDSPFSFEIVWKGISVLLEPQSAVADLGTGDARVEATVLGGLIPFVARVNLFEKRFDGIDFWSSIDRGFEKLKWPKVRFSQN